MSAENILSLRESFIVRIWRENEQTKLWRGQIQHVGSGEVVPITDVRHIATQLEDYLKNKDGQNTGLK